MKFWPNKVPNRDQRVYSTKHTGTTWRVSVISFTWKVQFVYFHVIYTKRSTKGRSSSANERLPPAPNFFIQEFQFLLNYSPKISKKRAPILSKRKKKNENCHRAERNNPNIFPVISKFPPNFFQEMKKFKLPAQFNSRSQWRFAMKCQTGIYLNLRWVIGINCLTWSTIFCLWVIV